MNTSNLKKYAPQARRDFKEAVSRRLNAFGISADSKGQIVTIEPQICGSIMQIGNNNFDAKINSARNRLINACNKSGFDAFVEHVAYTWFNRLCAIRYMELHDYLDHGFRVLSHPNNPTSFEILDHAQDVAEALGLDRSQLIELKLAGVKDEELYRELLLAQCHALHVAMPFLFKALDDEAELLLPDNLTRTDSILRGLVDGIPEEDWQQVEVIGWLYQFYISEKKDQVMGKVVKSEDIPAATQLFTPNWIVKYLVQNSVGRQWLQTYPDSAIKTQMEYYIEPAEQSDEVNQQLKAITPESIEPETIKVLDPACGSGHILIEAYNVLKAIYEERGFRSRDIPKMILENNLYGLDIDDRAAQLSVFALMMMARDDDKRIFTRNVRLNVLSLQESNHIDLPTLWKALNLSGSWQSGTSQRLFSDEEQDLSSFNADNRYQLLKRILARFTQAKTFGSLIDVPSDEHEQLKELLSTLVELQASGDSIQKPAAKKLIEFVHQALVLSIRYDAVIANPPYMGGKGMNGDIKAFASKSYPSSKSDLFAIFIERSFELSKTNGICSLITMQSWMFLSSFEALRKNIIESRSVCSLVQIGYNSFPALNSKIAQAVMFSISKAHIKNLIGTYVNLNDAPQSADKNQVFLNRSSSNIYEIISSDFIKIPGSPFAFWVSDKVKSIYDEKCFLNDYADPRQGFATGDNDTFLRYWYEVSFLKIGTDCESIDDLHHRRLKWVPCNKGGAFRRWYGNRELVVAFDTANYNKLLNQGNNLPSRQFYFRQGWTWSTITSSSCSFRYSPKGSVFETKGSVCFPRSEANLFQLGGYLNSKLVQSFLFAKSQTLDYHEGPLRTIPFKINNFFDDSIVKELIHISKFDHDSFETSFEFIRTPMFGVGLLRNIYSKWRESSIYAINRMKYLEEVNNKVLADFYGLADEIDPTVSLKEISLFVNTVYKFGEDDYLRLQSESFSDIVSYSIGCMVGRYSLDREGLVYAHSGNEGFAQLVVDGAYSTFSADEDGIIPLTDQEWFKDDATNRFREFVKVVWGEEHLQENLDYVAESLCLNAIKPKKSEPAMETIRRYLSTQFYKDHLKTYKKRPIYWLFSSGKQKAFECLVYLHRYNEGTLSRMRTEYVTPLLGKYDAYIDQLKQQVENADSTAEANRLKKEQDALIKKQVELREFDDKLKHYADMRISLDLDDGVKVNYVKFGDLLSDVKAITGSDSGAE